MTKLSVHASTLCASPAIATPRGDACYAFSRFSQHVAYSPMRESDIHDHERHRLPVRKHRRRLEQVYGLEIMKPVNSAGNPKTRCSRTLTSTQRRYARAIVSCLQACSASRLCRDCGPSTAPSNHRWSPFSHSTDVGVSQHDLDYGPPTLIDTGHDKPRGLCERRRDLLKGRRASRPSPACSPSAWKLLVRARGCLPESNGVEAITGSPLRPRAPVFVDPALNLSFFAIVASIDGAQAFRRKLRCQLL